ncbi:MAG: trypsin-like peptidase domain-containing protein [Myxococcales bacterium]|nr:trypsin-like peptidase domain-containing protein [Myxococcales bacterium]
MPSLLPISMLIGASALAGPIDPPSPVGADGTYNPQRSFAPLVEAVQPAVVTIKVGGGGSARVPPIFEMLGIAPDDMPAPRGEGSGFIVSEGGLMLTNHHVIASGGDLEVVLHDGSTAEAQVLGSDESMDIALLRLEGERDWPHVKLGDSSDVQVGDWVLAIGNSLGLGPTATFGIVSGKGRVLGHDVFGRESFIQTDAAINQGNSGGPLFNLDGEVVGMNTAIIAGANTVGFSIPCNLIAEVLDDLEQRGKVSRGFLGVQPQTLTDELRTAFGVRAKKGAVVANVFDDTPAARSGLEDGDVVVKVDDAPIESDTDLIAAISSKRPGDQVQLEIERKKKKQRLRVVLAERPGDDDDDDGEPDEDQSTTEQLGMTLTELSTEDARRAGVRRGVVVQRIGRKSIAEGRLQPGDIIVEVNRREVDQPSDVERILSRTTGSAFLLVIRDDAQQFVALPLP